MLKRKLKALFSKGLRPHFSQTGEDVLIRPYLKSIKDGHYLDLGAYDPYVLSNTAILWTEGWSGCNVDANFSSIKKFKKNRPLDVNIFGAIVTDQERCDGKNEVVFYIDGDDATNQSATGSIIASNIAQLETKVPCYSIHEILDKCNFKTLDYLNIDLEGYDLKIISDFPFDRFSPSVITIEDHQASVMQASESPIAKVLFSKGYDFVARTYMTSVFLYKPG